MVKCWAAGLACLMLSGSALADGWLMAPSPVVPSSRPQTDAEKDQGKLHGRALPSPELLQPNLDSALRDYRPPKAALSGHFKAASSDVLPGLVTAWIAAFHKLHPKVEITLDPPFAGSLGAKELVSGKIDLAFVSRELRPDDVTDFQAKFGRPPLSVPVCGGTYRHYGFLDAVGFIVHPDNPLNEIGFEQLDALLSTTRLRGGAPIRNWGDLGLTGEWADKPIRVHAIKPWNGFEEFIRQRVLSVKDGRGEWRQDLDFAEVVFPIARAVAADRYALGYTGLAYLDAPVKLLALRPASGAAAVAPTYEAVAAADYPLSRLVFINLDKAPGKALDPALSAFLEFIVSRQGQAIVREQGIFLPLRAAQADKARALFQ